MSTFEHRVVLAVTALLLVAGLAACGGTPPGPEPRPATGGPAFVINSPPADSLTAGTFLFSVQPLDPAEVAAVIFRVGSEEVGADQNLRAFVQAADYPAGSLELSATVTGKDGGQSTRSLTVRNEPEPDSNASVGRDGAALGTREASGSLSTLVVPPGGMTGANVRFEARTQAEVLADTGVDYDALGLTFLGAQQIDTDREIDRTLAVTSGGFGPRVQPGQTVVNYLIMPDADGDGVGEVVVANSATVTPAGDVISDPPQLVQVGDVAGTSQLGSSSLRPLNELGGPPGTILRIPVSGFNSASAWNNVAVFDGAGESIEQTGVIHVSAAGAQTFVTVIPPLAPGNASVTLHNIGSGYSSEPFRIAVQALPAPAGDPLEVINDSLALLMRMLDEFDAITGEDSGEFQAAVNATWDYWLGSLLADGSASADQALADVAAMLEVSDFRRSIEDVLSELRGGLGSMQAGCNNILEQADTGIQVVGWMSRVPYAQMPKGGVDVLGPEMQGDMVGQGWKWVKKTALEIDRALGGNACDNGSAPLPGPTGPSENGSSGPGAVSGMGAAFSMGGGVVGVVSGPGLDPFSPRSSAQGRGRYSVRVDSSAPVPFSGSNDSSGYFNVPMTPAGEELTVTVIDTETGDVEVIQVPAPPAGESEFLSITFGQEYVTGTVTWTGAGGDSSWQNPANWSGGSVPGATDSVVINSAGADVLLSGASSIINSLDLRRGGLTIEGNSTLHLLQDSFVRSAGNLQLASSRSALELTGDLQLESGMTWSGGEVWGPGSLINHGELEVDTFRNVRYLYGVVNNHGQMIISGGGNEGIRVGNAARIHNEAGAVIDFREDNGFAFGGAPYGELHNFGVVRKTGGTDRSRLNVIYHSHGGRLSATAGSLVIETGGTLAPGSNYEAAAGATIDLGASSSTLTVSGEQRGSGDGFVRLTGGTMEITEQGAEFNFTGGGLVWAGTLVEGPGTLSNTGLLTVDTEQGTSSGINDTVLQNASTIVLRGRDTYGLRMGGGATLHNLPGALIEIRDDTDLNYGGGDRGVLLNEGTLRKLAGTGTSSLPAIVNNAGGSIEVVSGNLSVMTGSSAGGTFDVAAGATLELGQGTAAFMLSGTVSGTGEGAVRAVTALQVDEAATVHFPSGGFQVTGGALDGTGTLTNTGILEFALLSGDVTEIYGMTVVNRNVINVHGADDGRFRGGRGSRIINESGATFDIRGDHDFIRNGDPVLEFVNAGLLVKSAGTGISTLGFCYRDAGGVQDDGTGQIQVTGSCPP